MEYVRCFFCDSSVNVDQIKIYGREKNIKAHDICTWECPACNLGNTGNIFNCEK